jgi:sugar lactone lactonase YvrE
VNPADTLNSIEVPGERAYPESISAAPDGTLYVSSLASGGIARIKPGASKAEPWIKPGAFDSRSTLGVLVDERSKLLWVCSTSMRLARRIASGPKRAPLRFVVPISSGAPAMQKRALRSLFPTPRKIGSIEKVAGPVI